GRAVVAADDGAGGPVGDGVGAGGGGRARAVLHPQGAAGGYRALVVRDRRDGVLVLHGAVAAVRVGADILGRRHPDGVAAVATELAARPPGGDPADGRDLPGSADAGAVCARNR